MYILFHCFFPMTPAIFCTTTLLFLYPFHLMPSSYVLSFSSLSVFWNFLIAHQSFVYLTFSFSSLKRRSMSFPSLLLASLHPSLIVARITLLNVFPLFSCISPHLKLLYIYLSFSFMRLSLPAAVLPYSYFPFCFSFCFSFLKCRSMSFPSLLLASLHPLLIMARITLLNVFPLCSCINPHLKLLFIYLSFSFARLSLPSADLPYSHFPFCLFVCGHLMLKQIRVFVHYLSFCFCLNLCCLSPSLPLSKC